MCISFGEVHSNSGREYIKGTTHFPDLGVDGKIILTDIQMDCVAKFKYLGTTLKS
jgi:hypothetical protein